MIAASQENTVVGIRKFFTSSLRLIIFRHFSAKYDFVAEKKRLVVFLTASGELLGSPSVSKPLEKSWTYSLSSPDNTSNPQVTHFVAEKKRSLYIACNASDVIGPNPHTSPIIRGLALSTSDATHALRDISRAPSDIAAIAPHRFRIRNLLCSP